MTRCGALPILLILAALALPAPALGATYYVDATGGADSAPGTSPLTPWKTVGRVNDAALSAGDHVLFKRGERWREALEPASGSVGSPVIYAAYGAGPKPLLMGSYERSAPGDWMATAPGEWATGGVNATVVGPDLLPNPSFAAGTTSWSLYVGGSAAAYGFRDTFIYDSAPASYRVSCTTGGGAGADLQLYTSPLSLTEGAYYRLRLRARASAAVTLTSVKLMQAASPYADYASATSQVSMDVDTSWQTFDVFFKASVTATDGRITLYLGADLPSGTSLWVDSLSLRRLASKQQLYVDVGSLILGGGASVGVKQWARADMTAWGDFYYDPTSWTVYLAEVANPAVAYGIVEAALTRDIIHQSGVSHVVYQDLHLTAGAAHGIGGEGVSHVVVRGCDFSWIGGGQQYGTVRYGNGIELWGDAEDVLVTGCTFSEIYDAAMTNQSSVSCTQADIRWVNNLVWHAEYCYEYWNRPSSSVTSDVVFQNNTCLESGGGWGHAQRPDPSGRDLCFFSNEASISGFDVSDNLLIGAASASVFVTTGSYTDLANLALDYNDLHPAGDVADWQGTAYATLATYQAGTSQDLHSISADPLFAAGPGGAWYLSQIASGEASDSPAVGAGSVAAAARCYTDETGTTCMDDLTTRTDSGPDLATLNLGFHYEP